MPRPSAALDVDGSTPSSGNRSPSTATVPPSPTSSTDGNFDLPASPPNILLSPPASAAADGGIFPSSLPHLVVLLPRLVLPLPPVRSQGHSQPGSPEDGVLSAFRKEDRLDVRSCRPPDPCIEEGVSCHNFPPTFSAVRDDVAQPAPALDMEMLPPSERMTSDLPASRDKISYSECSSLLQSVATSSSVKQDRHKYLKINELSIFNSFSSTSSVLNDFQVTRRATPSPPKPRPPPSSRPAYLIVGPSFKGSVPNTVQSELDAQIDRPGVTPLHQECSVSNSIIADKLDLEVAVTSSPPIPVPSKQEVNQRVPGPPKESPVGGRTRARQAARRTMSTYWNDFWCFRTVLH